MVAWVMGIQLDLDFKLLETGALAVSILLTSFALQVYDYQSIMVVFFSIYLTPFSMKTILVFCFQNSITYYFHVEASYLTFMK